MLIKLIQAQPDRYKFEGATRFKFTAQMERGEERFNILESLFERLALKSYLKKDDLHPQLISHPTG